MRPCPTPPQLQIQPEVVCQPLPASAVYVKQWFGSWAPGPYESGTDQPVLKFCVEASAWTSDADVRFEPALLAASTKRIPAVQACWCWMSTASPCPWCSGSTVP